MLKEYDAKCRCGCGSFVMIVRIESVYEDDGIENLKNQDLVVPKAIKCLNCGKIYEKGAFPYEQRN